MGSDDGMLALPVSACPATEGKEFLYAFVSGMPGVVAPVLAIGTDVGVSSSQLVSKDRAPRWRLSLQVIWSACGARTWSGQPKGGLA